MTPSDRLIATSPAVLLSGAIVYRTIPAPAGIVLALTLMFSPHGYDVNSDTLTPTVDQITFIVISLVDSL